MAAIGDTITGGSAGSVLFIDSNIKLAQDSNDFTYDPATNTLKSKNQAGGTSDFAIASGDGTATNSSSSSGDLPIKTGAGNANSTSGVPAGNSGTVTIASGPAGAASGGATSAVSGDLLLKAGAGGGNTSANSSGGNAGSIILQPGSGGPGTLSNGTGGSTIVRASANGSDILTVRDSAGTTTHLGVANNGNVRVGASSATARLHLGAGTSSLAPLKFTAGTNLSSPQAGALEWDGSKLYMSLSSTNRRALEYSSEVANVLDFGAVGNGTTDDSAAFQAAVDSLVNTGGVVWVPPNRIYALGSTISIKSKYSIWIKSSMVGRLTGGGSNTHGDKGLIRPLNNLGYLFDWTNPESAGTPLEWSHGGGGGVEGLCITDWITASSTARSKTIEGAIRVHTFGQWFCINCNFEWLTGRAIHFGTTIYSQLRNVKVYACGAAGKPPIDIEGFMSGLKAWQYDDSASSFVDETSDASSATGGDLQLFPAIDALGDYFAIGYDEPFGTLTFSNAGGTPGVGGTVQWQYWNVETSLWTNLSVTDGTNSFKASGTQQRVTFTPPEKWGTRTLNGSASLYYVRAIITTPYTTNPVYDWVKGSSNGLVWWDRGFLENCQYDDIEKVVRLNIGCGLTATGLYFENSVKKQLDGTTDAEQCPFIDAGDGGGMVLDHCTFNNTQATMVIVGAVGSAVRNSSFTSFLSGDVPHLLVMSGAQQSTFENLRLSGSADQTGRAFDVQAPFCQVANIYMNTTGRLNIAGLECTVSNIYMYHPAAAIDSYAIDLSQHSVLAGAFIDGFLNHPGVTNPSVCHGVKAGSSTVTSVRVRRLSGSSVKGIVSMSSADVIADNHVGELSTGATPFVKAAGAAFWGNHADTGTSHLTRVGESLSIPLNTWHNYSNGTYLTTTTTPALTFDGTNHYELIRWPAGDATNLRVSFALPERLDGDEDVTVDLFVRTDNAGGGGIDAASFTVYSSWDNGATVSDAATDSSPSETLHTITATIAASDIPSSARRLTLILEPAAHANDPIILTDVRVNTVRMLAAV